ncbi:MAG: hypothetical protein MJZ23_01175 [Paludibacteraceae bacterium]|nr:hypothetical protein [Paludibacteraceae bacterium]
MTKKFKNLLTTMCAMGFTATAWGQTMPPLVAETDFSAKDDSQYFVPVEQVDGYGSTMVKTSLTSYLNLTEGTSSVTGSSVFLDNPCYAVTPNPIRLDSLRFADNNDSGEWGYVFSGGSKPTLDQKVLNFTVTGLKNNGNYTVEIEYCNPHSETFLSTAPSNKNPHLSQGYVGMFRVGINPSFGGGEPVILGQKSGTQTITFKKPTSPNATIGDITKNQLSINITSQLGMNEAIMIKSIKVYAEVDPTIKGEEQVCVGGFETELSIKETYNNVSYQWYKNGAPIVGATDKVYTHVSGLKEASNQYNCEITSNSGEKIKSSSFVVNDILCCENDEGKPMNRKLVWQDDFGTFENDSTYWTWDYSDLNNPTKKYHKSADKWVYSLDYSIPGAKFNNPIENEGEYCVAANVTCKFDGAKEGTQWEWQAYCFNGESPMRNGWDFAPDHTYKGDAYGAMLFLNCGNEANEVIYSRVIQNLDNKEYIAKYYINNFTDAEAPVKTNIRLTDLGSGLIKESEPVERQATTSGIAWVADSLTIDITGNALLLEIISVAGGPNYNRLGNDLLLDDIQLWACVDKEEQIEEPIDYFKGYNPSISGAYESCILDSVTYKISVVKEDLEYHWLIDGNSAGDGQMIQIEASEAGDHVIACVIEDPLGNSMTKEMKVIYTPCCLNENKEAVKRILVWQDDFGTFENENSYWTWDYADLKNPTKVYHKATDKWVYELEDGIPGFKFDPSLFDGNYCVAANVTCKYDGAKDGTQWGWQAYCFNKETPMRNGWDFAPDHTYNGDAYGAMLFVNCGKEANEVIYKKTIRGIESGKEYIAKCFVNTFGDTDNPIAVKIRITDINNGTVYESGSRSPNVWSTNWEPISVSADIFGDELTFEIISETGANDLILDDIQLWTCDFSSETAVETTEAQTDDKLVNVYTTSGIMVMQNVKKSDAIKNLKKGIYIVGGEKVIINK